MYEQKEQPCVGCNQPIEESFVTTATESGEEFWHPTCVPQGKKILRMHLHKKETASVGTPAASQVSDTEPAACYGQKDSPQVRKREKVVERVREITGATLPYQWAQAVDDMVRTGLRRTNKEEEEACGHPLHCCTEYHFMRMTGKGSTLVPLIYPISLRIAKRSENFFISLAAIAQFLGIPESDEYLYAAAALLVASGFWEVRESKPGKAVHYRPLIHSKWAQKCGTEDWNGKPVGIYCTVKGEFPYKENTPESKLGRLLHGITGERYFTGVLKGWLKLGSPELLENWAKEFMAQDAGQKDGTPRRIRLADHFRACAARQSTSNLPAKHG